MARVTISELQGQLQALRSQLTTQQQVNRELREEMATLRAIVAIASSVLERVTRK